MRHPAIDIESMSPEERLELIGELWDSLRCLPDSVPVLQSHREELDARLEVLKRGESELIDWDEARRRMRS